MQSGACLQVICLRLCSESSMSMFKPLYCVQAEADVIRCESLDSVSSSLYRLQRQKEEGMRKEKECLHPLQKYVLKTCVLGNVISLFCSERLYVPSHCMASALQRG